MAKTYRILCVDDEPYVLKALQRLFLDTEFDVFSAHNALDGMELLQNNNSIAAVITDYRMPGMNGVEFLSEVYRSWPEISRIILSGYADTATVLEAINQGHVDKFIPKPWEDDVIVATVRSEVDRYKLKIAGHLATQQIRRKVKDLTISNVKLQKVVEAKNVALKASETRLKEAQKIARMGDWEWTAATGEMFWSEGMYAIHEVKPISFHPSLTAYGGLLPREDRELFREQIHACLQGGDEFTFSHRCRTPNGKLRHMVVRGRLRRALDGEVVGLQATTIDDTERVVLTEELQRLNGELEGLVRHRTQELENKVAELDAFTAAVSHDLRAPLRQLSSFCQILSDILSCRLGEQEAELLAKISCKSKVMSEMVDALLELSRLGRYSIEREEVNVTALATDILQELYGAEPDRKCCFTVEHGLVAFADRQLLVIMLTNLVGNAWKYSVNQPETRISLTATAGDDGPIFCIQDNGAGFDMQYADKLFLPFQRLHRQDEFAGIGIGLATVARIVRLHGGHIWAESEPGIGARFFFTVGC
jgi:signal transduction histidine kinase/FixJ family two-component response regulator